MSDAQFKGAYAALMFAFTFSIGAKPNRDAVNQMSTPSKSTGRGLGGMDGAAQAGMIRAELASCGRQYEVILIAKLAPSRIPCNCGSRCCMGSKPNDEWQRSFTELAELTYLAMQSSHKGTRGVSNNFQLRSALIRKYLGSRDPVKDIALKAEVSEQTAHSHKVLIFDYLRSLESKAWVTIETKLCSVGITNPIEARQEVVCLEKTQSANK